MVKNNPKEFKMVNHSESYIESQSTKFAKANGWLSYKWVSPGNAGVPDRIFIKAGRVVFVEFKAAGQKPRPLQVLHGNRLMSQGCEVHYIDSIAQAKEIFV